MIFDMRLDEITAKKPTVGKIFYHGTTKIFDHFDLAFIGAKESIDAYGPGFYFTDNIDTARRYAGSDGVILACRLTPRKLIKETGPVNPEWVLRLMRRAPDLDDTLSNWAENKNEALRMAFDSVYQANEPKNTYESLWFEFYRNDPALWAKRLSGAGSYDGIYLPQQNNETFIVMINPDKIKIIERIKV